MMHRPGQRRHRIHESRRSSRRLRARKVKGIVVPGLACELPRRPKSVADLVLLGPEQAKHARTREGTARGRRGYEDADPVEVQRDPDLPEPFVTGTEGEPATLVGRP